MSDVWRAESDWESCEGEEEMKYIHFEGYLSTPKDDRAEQLGHELIKLITETFDEELETMYWKTIEEDEYNE